VKKCASCAKDLPEAALHCVFCGAKQAPAPAVQPGLAKTAFGYSQNEIMQQLGNRPQAGGYQPPQQPSYQQPPQEQPRPHSPSQPQQYGGVAPSANAATVMAPPGSGPPGFTPQAPASNAFAQTAPAPAYNPPAASGYGQPQGGGYGQPQGGYGQPQGGYGGAGYQQPYTGAGGMGIHSPPQPTPSPLPVAHAPPYLASNTAARAGRPIEPWKDTLKLMMIVWGAVALVSFLIPATTDPMAFNWDAIIDAPGKAKIEPLIWAAVGLLSIAMALIPMATVPRGIIAAVLGLTGLLVSTFINGMPPWQMFLPIIGLLTLVPGLFVRHEYTESLLARILVTVGVIAILLPLLIPNDSGIPLVQTFKGLINADGERKVVFALQIALIVVVVLSLLAWMPGPATGGANVFAWILLLFPILFILVGLLLDGHIGDVVTKAPGMLVSWAPAVVYGVLSGYGLATVIGKQLE
jgi:hypothetical protein